MAMSTIDIGNVVYKEGEFQDELLTFTGVATYPAGTILARDSSTLKLIAFVKGGVTNGNGVPKAVLTYPVTSTGAGDVGIRAMISGVVTKKRLVIFADLSDTNVDMAVRDQLRAVGIVPVIVDQAGV
jgi:hypothetical protein